jgi:hypothetical protein
VGAVVVAGGAADEGLWLESSTAIIATTPMAAAPIPANRKVRFPELRVTGCDCIPFW